MILIHLMKKMIPMIRRTGAFLVSFWDEYTVMFDVLIRVSLFTLIFERAYVGQAPCS